MKKIFPKICISLFFATLVFASQAVAQIDPRVEVTNETKSLQVVSANIVNNELIFIGFKNTGKKTIISYEMFYKEGPLRLVRRPNSPSNALRPNEIEIFRQFVGSATVHDQKPIRPII
ncbi:MAG: hypothetical protein L0226_00915 [Acidobacteria bacterium]|nr:hypothetical protein [Acidobacteriota bacterium]